MAENQSTTEINFKLIVSKPDFVNAQQSSELAVGPLILKEGEKMSTDAF